MNSRLLYLKKNHNEKTDNPPIRIDVNKIEFRIKIKIKTRYYLKLLTHETMSFLESTEKKITKDKNGENAHHLEITETVLVNCNIVNKDYQQDSRVLYTFAADKSFGSLLEIAPANSIFLKTFRPESLYIEVWLTDQNSLSLTLVIKWKMRYSIEP